MLNTYILKIITKSTKKLAISSILHLILATLLTGAQIECYANSISENKQKSGKQICAWTNTSSENNIVNEGCPKNQPAQTSKLNKVTFFIENSGSMLGYVTNYTDYVNALVTLAYLEKFDSAKKEFFFINGTNHPDRKSKLSINFIGTQATDLQNKLNPHSYNSIGDPRYSDLTAIFESALKAAKNDEISILVSDCIFDVGHDNNPLTALKIETEKTKKTFREKLSIEDMQTLIIKAESQFSGLYYFASKSSSPVKLNQKRPYYIIIFGRSEILNELFNEDYLSRKIPGYLAMARFLPLNNYKIKYQVTSENIKGKFKFDKSNKNKLIDAKKNRQNEFQFTVAVDFSSLPFSNDYFKDINNYNINGNYKILSIYNPTKELYGLGFTPSHLIVVNTGSNPYGNIEISLNNKLPSWISESSSKDEGNIVGDTKHTYGFMQLIESISDAYEYKNRGAKLANMNIQILK